MKIASVRRNSFISINTYIVTKIINFLFGPDASMIWTEAPYSKQGKSMDVWHYRLFCDENWQLIIKSGSAMELPGESAIRTRRYCA